MDLFSEFLLADDAVLITPRRPSSAKQKKQSWITNEYIEDRSTLSTCPKRINKVNIDQHKLAETVSNRVIWSQNITKLSLLSVRIILYAFQIKTKKEGSCYQKLLKYIPLYYYERSKIGLISHQNACTKNRFQPLKIMFYYLLLLCYCQFYNHIFSQNLQ